MKKLKEIAALALTAAMLLSCLCVSASAKTAAAGQTVGTVLFYVENAKGEEILASHIAVTEMEADMQAGKIDTTNHNYSLLDRYVTTVHQEAQGFTAAEFVEYAQSKSTVAAIRDLDLTFAGQDKIAFWEIDQNGFDEMDTYTYDELYGTARYNYPLLYEYWNYRTQDYYDPNGVMTREQVIDYIFDNAEPATFLLSVRAFSQRFMITEEKYDGGDYNMENYWLSQDKLDNERTIRVMKPMTEDELRNKTSSASDTRYWVSNIKLDMAKSPSLTSLGKVAKPTAVMTEDADNYYITFDCATPGATILYNHNYISPSYTPSCEYTGGSAVVPKSWFPDGVVTMTCRAVKDGYTDYGVQTLTLTSSGKYQGEKQDSGSTGTAQDSLFSDVGGGSWYYNAVSYVVQEQLFNGTSATTFSPDGSMTRSMFATVLHRFMGKPAATAALSFSDTVSGTWYSDAVAWASEKGYVNGTGNNRFSPEAEISLEQMLTVLYRVSGSPAVSAGVPTQYGTVSAWAADAMAWAQSSGLLSGVGGTLTATGSTTRAQVAAILMNFSK